MTITTIPACTAADLPVREIVKAVHRTATRTPPPRLGSAMRAILRTFGPSLPMGDGDAKTASPGTYRPVGPTCPASCPMLPSSRRGGSSEIDWTYVDALASLTAEYARVARTGDRILAWTYTHETDASAVEELRRRLPLVSIRHSDHYGPMGAIVAPFATTRGLRKAGLAPLRCPAQRVQGITCATCRACWEAPERVIVFEPHGAQARKAGNPEAQGGCYAATGNVGIHQARATAQAYAAARTAIGAIAWAHATGRLARLHVSGDFHRAAR